MTYDPEERLVNPTVGFKSLATHLRMTIREAVRAYFSPVAIIRGWLTSESVEDSKTDPITTLLSRGPFYQRLRRQVILSRSQKARLSLILATIEGLTRINDTLGHGAGDQILRTVGLVLRDQIPRTGFAGRLGGTEFVAALPRVDADQAQVIAAIAGRKIEEICLAQFGDVAASMIFTVAELGETDEQYTDLLKRAEAQLWEKRTLATRHSGDQGA